MRIRQLTKEEAAERVALSEFAFQLELTEQQREERKTRFRPEEQWGAFDDEGKMLSALHLAPLEIYIGQRSLKMGGVAGVATWPEARRHGCVAKLLAHALGVMRGQGQTVSMLHPFSFPFYRKYGWEMTIERKQYEIESKQLPAIEGFAGQVVRIPKEASALNGVYERFARRYTGMLKRSEEWWEQRALSKPGLAALYRNGDGTPEGYILYDVRNRLMTVHEWAALTEEARRGLWSFVANHDSMADKIAMTVPVDDATSFWFADPRFKQEIIPYFMSRIVDAAGFVAQYPFLPGSADEALTITLIDRHAPWNNGTFRLEWDRDGTARMQQTERQSAGAGIACDIQTLTALLLGNRRPEQMARWGRLQGDGEAVSVLERRVPSLTPYLADFF